MSHDNFHHVRTFPTSHASARLRGPHNDAHCAAPSNSTAPDPYGDGLRYRSVSTSRFQQTIDREKVMADLEGLVDGVVQTIAATAPAPDSILGRFVRLTSLCRSISFHEGRLLEAALIRLAEINPNLIVLSQGLRLPITKAAVEAVANNRVENLRRLTLDSEVAARSGYTPDLILIDRKRHAAQILDMKRSVASYLEARLDDLKSRMMAAALVFPDWLYREHKRLYVDDVSIGIIDGASAESDPDSGIWALSDIDKLIDVHGAAEAMLAMRQSFGKKVQLLLRGEAQAALMDLPDNSVRARHATSRSGRGDTFDVDAQPDPRINEPFDLSDDGAPDDDPETDRDDVDDERAAGGSRAKRDVATRSGNTFDRAVSRATASDRDPPAVRFGFLKAVSTH